MSRIVELTWECGECSTKGVLGRHKRCPHCGASRELGEMDMDGLGADDYDSRGVNKAETVTDPKLLDLANAGADRFCPYCSSGNRGDADRCSACGANISASGEEGHQSQPEIAETPRPVKVGSRPGGRWGGASEESRENKTVDDPETPSAVGRIVSVALLAFLAVAVLGAFVWAFQTHEAEGTVSQMTWQQSTIRQHWTQVTIREWQHRAHTRRETKPVNGSGERAGMAFDGGCRQEHYDDEKYVCGSHPEPVYGNEDYSCQKTRTITSASKCGESCSRDKKNGFATCRPKTCSENYQGTCTRRVKTGTKQVNDYCTRPIYEARCDYRTQKWQTDKTVPAEGTGPDTTWPVIEEGPEDRLRYAADYSVAIRYEDGGDQTHKIKPGKTKWLGMQQKLTAAQAHEAERAYTAWKPGETVTLTINNLGGVRSVKHGGIEIVAEAE